MATSVTQLSWMMICAALPLCFLPTLPSQQQLYALGVLALILLMIRWRHGKTLALLLLLFIWCCFAGRQVLDQITRLSTTPVTAEVQIEHISGEGQRLNVRLLTVQQQQLFPPLYATLNGAGWVNNACVGQRWRMTLNLRPVHARLNQGDFDLQRQALANHSPLNGRILAAEPLQQSCSWRQSIIAMKQPGYQQLPWQAVISALAFGERGEMPAEMTQLLRQTGTAHLMAISGMHIGLAALFGWLMARGAQFFFPAHWIGYRFPLFVSLLVALLYGWLSGANPPAVRAMLALIIWGLLRLSGLRCSGWQVWSLCVAVILFFDPLTILSDSFWLSALAVAALLLWYHWFPLPARFMVQRRWLLLQLLHLQLGMMLLLMPVQAYIFHGVSFSALVANLIAVPVVSLVSVPLILLSLLIPVNFLSQPLWWLVDRSLALVINSLQLLPDGWLMLSEAGALSCLLCWLLLVVWRFNWWRSSPVTVISLMVTLVYWRQSLPAPDWRIDMLDVGHGLAVVISREGKAVIYDTGNRWPGGDAGERIIAPWLRWQGIEPQQVIISHAHLDHIGGLASLQRAWPQLTVRSALDKEGHLPCYQGERWQWQQLNFQVLWPLMGNQRGANNDSCVLLVDDGRYRVLLTGDLEAPAERALVAHYQTALRADIIQVPHHGSSTSSTALLLRHVQGSAALASVARFNSWRLPAKQIIHRYQGNGYQWHDTALSGQLSVQFSNENWQVRGLREQILPRWYHQWFGVPRESR
ncbi:ComEC family protein [Erwiniaceae bacterium BAC15a-03b]|uniref:ComEC family protein n=1 Tax=Winslowiella arboricola TaxID=2978220 RepID=A0A9J6PXP6_9GAMM|nr:ComEC family protein [Winslowiella arboricola]MCU5775028.1 ComEC family protein [Winslowiella arboricola]MCU5780517.1 ComEC family protein [Winslowiella arboricola]